MPELTREDEEFQMLRKWARKLTEEIDHAKKSGKKINVRVRSGLITQSVIRKHIQNHDLSVSQNGVSITPSTKKIHLLVLKNSVNPDKKYSHKEVHTVVEIRNNAVCDIVRKTKEKFKEIENLTKVNRFAVVVLSENPNYPQKYKKENTRNLFTCILRERTPKQLYNVDAIEDMLENGELWKTGEWDELINYLKKPTNTPLAL